LRRYSLSRKAEQDLREIKDYLAEAAGSGVARRVLHRIRQSIVRLADSPGIGHSREDLTSHRVKFWPVFSYLVVYAPEERPLLIVRVLHAKRDVAAILRREAE
jgi:antitoxin ParD1/3/4/toxin ParE1/3/4